MSSYLNIPKNVKQYFLPFVLDPNNPINSTLIQDEENNGGTTQVFSFKPSTLYTNRLTPFEPAAGFIRIAPSSYYAKMHSLNKDISYQTLYKYQKDQSKIIDPSSVSVIETLNNTPSIIIREYLQNSKLDMVVDFLKNSFQMLTTGWQHGKELAEKLKAYDNKADALKYAFKAFNFQEKLINEIQAILGEISIEPPFPMQYYADSDYPEVYNAIIKFPYALYYNIIATTSTNIYEIPFSGKTIYASQGGGFSKSAAFGLDTKGDSLLGTAINWFGKNIRMNINPTWDGPQDTPTKFDIEFTLYNDDIDSAIKNFIFVNTIVPGNKWLQYHIFQHAPNLYDIRINGIDRLFMCQGDFTVDYAGQLRKPSYKLLNELCHRYANTREDEAVNSLFGEYNYQTNSQYAEQYNFAIANNVDSIRIPDQYNIKMTFTSLLPNNFNNFLYSYWYNDPIKKMGKNCEKPLTQKSVAGEFLEKSGEAVKKLAEDFSENFDQYAIEGLSNATEEIEPDEEDVDDSNDISYEWTETESDEDE